MTKREIENMGVNEIRKEIRNIDKTIRAKKDQGRNNLFQHEKEKTTTEIRALNETKSILNKTLKSKDRQRRTK